MKHLRPRAAGVLAAVVVAGALMAGGAATHAARDATQVLTPALRSDVVGLLAGRHARDPRLNRLVAGHRPGEIAYFVLLGTPTNGLSAGKARLRPHF